MIRGDVEPIGHVPPRKRTDPSHPGRKAFISALEWVDSGTRHEPDPAIYQRDFLRDGWVLKEGI